MKNQQDPKDPTKALLSSVGITKNEQTDFYEVSVSPQGIRLPADELDEEIPGLEKPNYYPNIVLRLMSGIYCYFPVHISGHMGTMEEYRSRILGMYRELVVRPENIDDEKFLITSLMRMTRAESIHHKCPACLCLGPDNAFFYDSEKDNFYNSTDVPSNTNWLSSEAYMNITIRDFDDERAHHIREMNKSLTRQYFLFDEN